MFLKILCNGQLPLHICFSPFLGSIHQYRSILGNFRDSGWRRFKFCLQHVVHKLMQQHRHLDTPFPLACLHSLWMPHKLLITLAKYIYAFNKKFKIFVEFNQLKVVDFVPIAIFLAKCIFYYPVFIFVLNCRQ